MDLFMGISVQQQLWQLCD